jgi:hypothetical protein
MKWCQRCGQRMQIIEPGDKCQMCNWQRPAAKTRKSTKPTIKKGKTK